MDTELGVLTSLFIGFSILIYLVIAIIYMSSDTEDFYVAGRQVPPILNGMATAADWMSAASFISMAGMIAFGGYGGSVFLMGWTGGYVLLALLIVPYLRKYGAYTVPEFIAARYYSSTARLVAVICLILISLTYVIGQMKGVGVVFSRFLEVDYSTGLIVGVILILTYVVVGGMQGITYTQVAQYCILIFAYTLPAIYISLQMTGNPIPQLGLGSTLGDNIYLLDKLDQILKDLGFHEYTTDTRVNTLNMTAYALSLMIGTAGLPHIIMRFFTVPKVSDARKSAAWSLLFIAILYTTAPAVGAMARLNLIDLLTKPTEENIQGLVYEERPAWVKRWEKTGLLVFEDRNQDGIIEYHADPAKNEVIKVDKDIIVLASPEMANLPAWLVGLMLAGGLAAALSTAAGLLLAISSAVSHDVVKAQFMPYMSDEQELHIGRIAIAITVIICGYLGLNPPDFAAGTVAIAFGLAAASLFPALVMGIFSKNITKEGAIAGMLVGMGITLFYVFQHKGILFIADWSYLGPLPKNWFLGIEPNAFGVIGALFNFMTAWVVSRFTQPVPEKVQNIIEQIHIPKGKALIHDH